MRRLALLGATVAIVLCCAPRPAAAQIEPTVPEPTTTPTVPDTTTPPTTAPPPSTTVTTRRPVTTTTIPPTTTIPDVITVPTIEPDPADTEVPGPGTGGGGISPIFSMLSIAGFATAIGILARQWYTTRPTIRDH